MRLLPTPDELLKKMEFSTMDNDGVWEISIGPYFLEVYEEEDNATAGIWGGFPRDSQTLIAKERSAFKEEAFERLILKIGEWAEKNRLSPEFEEWFFPYEKVSSWTRIVEEDLLSSGL